MKDLISTRIVLRKAYNEVVEYIDYFDLTIGCDTILLDGNFSIEELEALIWLKKNGRE